MTSASKCVTAPMKPDHVENNLSLHQQQHPLLRRLAARAMGMTGADIERIVREARLNARRERRSMTLEDIETGLRLHRPRTSPEKLMRNAVHEAGHALVHYVLGLGPIDGVTAESGKGAFGSLGFTLDRADTRGWVDDVLTMFLAGRAAELVILGEVTAGAGGTPDSDLARATEIALALERTDGLGSDLPLLYRPSVNSTAVLDGDRDLASRVHAHLVRAQTRASEIIARHRAALEALAAALVEAQALEGAEVVRILEAAGAKSAAR
jgi:ATP-dependent Zn protease